MDLPALAVVNGVCCEASESEIVLAPETWEKLTRVLVNDASLELVEAFARCVCPPLLELAFLVVQSAG
jgi:hypothetical protein